MNGKYLVAGLIRNEEVLATKNNNQKVPLMKHR